jgi:hypothetical protein
MTIAAQTTDEIRRLGGEYGEELAAALVLASNRGADHALKREMARLVLYRIEGAVEQLRHAAYPDALLAVYEQAVRKGVHDELVRNGVGVAMPERHAA